jgi:hypothetical protein
MLCECDGFNRECELKVASTMLPFFFKSNHNSNDASPLVIPLKFLGKPSSKANSRGNKVESNSKSRHINLAVQLVCPSGLATFIPPIAHDLFEVWVLPNKKDGPLPKKSKKLQ